MALNAPFTAFLKVSEVWYRVMKIGISSSIAVRIAPKGLSLPIAPIVLPNPDLILDPALFMAFLDFVPAATNAPDTPPAADFAAPPIACPVFLNPRASPAPIPLPVLVAEVVALLPNPLTCLWIVPKLLSSGPRTDFTIVVPRDAKPFPAETAPLLTDPAIARIDPVIPAAYPVVTFFPSFIWVLIPRIQLETPPEVLTF